MGRSVRLVPILLLLKLGFAQLPSSQCDSHHNKLQDCKFLVKSESSAKAAAPPSRLFSPVPTLPVADSTDHFISSPSSGKESFHWRRALTESFTFLVIEQAYVVHSDFNWVVSENGVPFNHYWRDYTQSLSTWIRSPWNDGDPNWFGFVGHPIQGALTGYIQIQNDPQGRELEFSKTRAYWWSRLKAGLWNAAYSTQWNLGPLSEVTVEKYGTKDRGPWNYNGSFPCYRHCVTGVGQIDLVMTPLGGTGWLIGEDFLDRFLVRRVEAATSNSFLIDAVRCSLNPVRSGANILHGSSPWYRASRDRRKKEIPQDGKAILSPRTAREQQVPNRASLSLGFSHSNSDPVSGNSANRNGWNISAEKKFLQYFGAVGDVSGNGGNTSQREFLVGLRGGASFRGFRPFAQVLFGAVQVRERLSPLATSFAEALGIGFDSPLTHKFSWRVEADSFKTSFATAVVRQSLQLSTGPVINF